jgi:hypothetical protein
MVRKMTFATMGDTDYTGLIDMNEKSIQNLYPDNEIIVERFEPCEVDQAMLRKPLLMLKVPLPCCYMDGDAILIKKLGVKINADVVVTVREHPRPNAKINNGVFILNNREFVHDWLIELFRLTKKRPGDRWNDQDAFNIVAYSGKYTIKEVPCEIYNYTRVEDGIPDDVKVVHMKKRRFRNPELLERVCDLLQDS